MAESCKNLLGLLISRYFRLPGLSIFLFALIACEDQPKQVASVEAGAIFKKVDSETSGIKFRNPINENAAFNLFKWKYIYNGAGVAVGDINHDGLSDIYFVANTGPNKLYINQGKLQFKDMTGEMGLTAMSGYQTGVSMVDLNGDNLLDIFICRDADPNPNFRNNLIYLNNGDSTFASSNAEMGMLDQSYTTQALFIDYDRDNDLDVFLINHPADFDNSIKLKVKRKPDGSVRRDTAPTTPYSGHKLYEFEAGKYTEVTGEMGLAYESFGLGGVVLDVNEDGWQDIFVANDFLEPDMLFINQQGKGFVESASKYFKHYTQNSMGVDFQDINNDGRGDLVVLDMLAESNYRQKSFATSMTLNQYDTWKRNGYGRQIMRNMLHLNLGGSFAEVGMLAGIEKSDWSWSPIIADFDLDGDNDLFVSNGIYKDMSDKDFIVYLSDSMSLARRKGIEALTAENYDEWIDLIPSTPLPNKLYLNEGRIKLRDVSPPESGLFDSTFTQGAAVGDLDGDGDLDLVTNNTKGMAMVYQNTTTGKNPVKITLEGPGQNRKGYNSKVTLFSDGKLQAKWLHANSGYLSSNEPELIFGLGKSSKVDSITVEWSDGTVQRFSEIDKDERLTLKYKDTGSQKYQNEDLKALEEMKLISPAFRHNDGSYDDFKKAPLLIKSHSRLGPAVAVADVNGDGQEDFFVGGGMDQPGELYLGSNSGFTRSTQDLLADSPNYEDVAACFFDLDQDGDKDLYVASGGSGQTHPDFYNDRIYINDGSGKFIQQIIRPGTLSGKVVLAFDYDQDGDDDLFVGNYLDPTRPYDIPESFLLINEGGKLTSENLGKIGHVTDAIHLQANHDSLPDLLVVGHWMSPTLLQQNKSGDFTNVSSKHWKSDDLYGFWNSITPVETGYILGNEGLNVPFEVDVGSPIRTYINDFDKNGMTDGIVTHWIEEQEYPYARRETITQQLPVLRKKFRNYDAYAKARFQDLFAREVIEQARVRQVNELKSARIVVGDSTLSLSFLPRLAQTTPIFAAAEVDKQILLAGNYHHNDVEIGPYDAGYGVLLSKEEVTLLNEKLLSGEIRALSPIRWKDQDLLLIVENNGELKIGKL